MLPLVLHCYMIRTVKVFLKNLVFFKSRNLPEKEKYVNDTYYLKIHKTKWFLSIKVFTFTDPYPNPQNPGIYSEVKFKQKLFLRNLSHSETCQNQFQFHHLFPFYVRDATRPPPSLPSINHFINFNLFQTDLVVTRIHVKQILQIYSLHNTQCEAPLPR